ncbi:MAG: C25 family cysteine peptidase, partial [Promethearchaeota archaeon]
LVDSEFFGMYNLSFFHEASQTYFNILHVPNAGHAGVIGKPSVPMITRYLEVPKNINFNLQVVYSEMAVLDDFYVIPAQEPHEDYPGAPEPDFKLDDPTYNTDAFFPSEVVSVETNETIIIRGHRVVPLSLYPVQFNPVKEQLKVYSKIEVRLKYDRPAQLEPVPDRFTSSAFEEFFDSFILNYRYGRDTPWFPFWDFGGKEGAEYLIITHDDFYDAIQPLASWKRQKGLITTVVKTSEIKATSPPTADEIADYIQDAYDTWDPVPAYVLLVGDAEFIPTFYRTTHLSASHGGGEIPTDLYYTTVDGTDYYPDIFIGRLSVDSDTQVTTIVNKILNYEIKPPTDADFYNQIAAGAYFQDDNTNGYEDRRFVLTSEEIRDYLTSQGYDVFRIYTADGAVTPTNYNNGVYDNGDPIPNDLLRANGFAWDGDHNDIDANITDGVFLIYHRDHGLSENFWHHTQHWWGWYDGWGDPDYETGDIAGLTNGDLLPVVLSVECQAGWFDGETDQNNDATLTHNFESFAETFLRHAGGGAVAVIAATRNSRSGFNDALAKGFIDAIWPGFDTSTATGGLYSLGQVLTYGKVYMASTFTIPAGWDDFTQHTFELFHLHGCPEMQIWTEEPGELDVKHPATIGSGGWQKFVVSVNDSDTGDPIPYAKVCLDGLGVYTAGYTNPDGQVNFTIYPSSAGGKMNITVTKHNYRPYIQEITATANGAVLTVQPLQGPIGTNCRLEGDDFAASETVNIYFGGATVDTTTTADSAGSFVIMGFNIPNGPTGLLNIVAVGQTSGKTAVALFRRLPDQPLPDPYIYCQWDSSTWHLATDGALHWNNPCVRLYDKNTLVFVESSSLVVGTTYKIEATIYNDATVDAVNTEVTFEWAFWGAGQKTWHLIGTGPDTITVPAGGNAIAEAEWTPSVTGHTCLMITVYHPWDEDFNNNNGQENTNVLPVTSPGEVEFTLNNPGDAAALIYLETKQLSAKGGVGGIWGAQIRRDYPQVQDPNEEKKVTFYIDSPKEAEWGEVHVFVVHAYLDGRLIGGVEIEVVKGNRTYSTWEPPLTGTDWDLTFSFSALFVIAAAVVLFRRYNKKKQKI